MKRDSQHNGTQYRLVMLSVVNKLIMLNVIMLDVVAPKKQQIYKLVMPIKNLFFKWPLSATYFNQILTKIMTTISHPNMITHNLTLRGRDQQNWYSPLFYMIMIKHWLSIYTSMKHSLPSLKLLALALNSLDILSDVRIKVFTLIF
jgi:hypothetical protein